MTAALDTALAAHGLSVAGAFHPGPKDRTPEGVATLVLVGADGGALWRVFSASPEFADGAPDPMDRWSRRELEGVASALGAQAFFPFGGPPYQPFQAWAARGAGAVPSPVGMQVSAARGLWVSYRGALGFAERLEIAPAPAANPCTGCPAPCRDACPVEAFAGGSYDVPRCVAHIAAPQGADCRQGGCLARHACPAGRAATPPKPQCGFHMEAFLRARLAAAR